MEIRYIVFTADEMRNAVIGFVQKQGQLAAPGDVAAVELVGPNEAPSAIVKLQPALAKKPINLGAQYLVAALLLYCMDRRIPIPKQAEKKVELSVNGLTLMMTTDASSDRRISRPTRSPTEPWQIGRRRQSARSRRNWRAPLRVRTMPRV
jgi:hypothetical protein